MVTNREDEQIGGSYAENNNPVLMALKCIPPPKVTQFLIDIFFRHAQGNNFYVSPREFCDDFVTAGLFSDSVPNASPDFIALVMMILGMGSQFAHLHPGAQKMAAPSGKQELGPGTIFYRKAQALLPLIIIKPGIFSTQVVFLMALFVLQSDLCNLAYIYFGMAIRSAIAIGLHQQGRGNVQISDTQHEIRRRLWWSIYAQERSERLPSTFRIAEL